jgi:hypothetical protein
MRKTRMQTTFLGAAAALLLGGWEQSSPAASAVPDGAAKAHARITGPIFDPASDGSIWVVGATYKAHVTARGLTFIPRLGADAPRNFPIYFALDSIECAVGPLAFEPGGCPVRIGHRLELDRGLLTEAYEARSDSIEQTFTFARPPVRHGGLVVRLSINTELTAVDAGETLRFGNQHGLVWFSKAVLVDARGVRTSLATSLVDGSHIAITVPASVLESAAWPITIDPVVQTNSVDGGVSNRKPDVAYDATSNTWLVVWETSVSAADGDVFARRTDAQGAPIGSVITIDSSTENWRNPCVANNDANNNFLVAAERGSGADRAIWGRVVSSAGATGSAFEISDPEIAGAKLNPDVGGDPFVAAPPVHWLVVWQQVTGPVEHDIHARLVTPSGPTAAAPSGATILIDASTSTMDINPAVSPSNRGFAWSVVWQRDMPSDDIMGARVFFDGTLLAPTFPIDNTPADSQNPSVATPFLTQRYVVVYEDGPGALGHIRARIMDESNPLVGGDLTLIENVASGLQRRRPSVDANASQFVITCEQESALGAHYDAYVSSYCWTGVSFSLAEAHRIVGNSPVADAGPVVAGASGSNGPQSQFMIAWNLASLATGLGPISAARYNTGTCCPADVDDNGSIDVDDLIAVILDWGLCATCAADIDGNGRVDVDDLIAVILGWGVCPS